MSAFCDQDNWLNEDAQKVAWTAVPDQQPIVTDGRHSLPAYLARTIDHFTRHT